MSKASEIAGYYAMSKKAMLIGLGYFAATNPKGTIKFLMRVAPPLVHSMARDSYLIIREAGKELVLPEARQVAKNIGRASSQVGRPMIWGGLAQPTFILMGGALAQIIHMGAEDFLEFFGMDDPSKPPIRID